MTNNLNVALALSRSTSCEITVAGGRLRTLDRDVVAGEAHGFFGRFAADIGIYGVGGVAEDGTLLDFSTDEVTMRSALAAHCRQRFLVLDHSKFGRGGTVRGGHITEASAVFTDRPVPETIDRQLREAGVRLVTWSNETESTESTSQTRRG
jgi:DeoR family glycerol-3-phosphate regulon repressor